MKKEKIHLEYLLNATSKIYFGELLAHRPGWRTGLQTKLFLTIK